MRFLVVLLLVLAGCAAPPDGDEPARFEVYVFEDPAADAFKGLHGMMFRVTNPGDSMLVYEVEAPGMGTGRFGPVHEDGWAAQEVTLFDPAAGKLVNRTWPSIEDTLAPGESRLWLIEAGYTATMHLYQFAVIADGQTYRHEQLLPTSGGTPVEPGMHVVTYTVGVWVNGTSFYTNIAHFNDDPAFPAGYDRSEFGGGGLAVYVYDEDASEQPASSQDTCHATTITGYNALLKTQAEHSTGVRFLSPEEAYTRPGNEDHSLYGDALVFLNRVALIEPDAAGPTAGLPDPDAPCFDADRHTPEPIPDVPPTA